ncbi:hypothetical protein AB0L57_09915 [Nocardia sp. NPDC052254]|uniref:hypothetical protein n=1 Tax=Nocardia sp. NPDC052254 TaxID=3155681 RepID=UPI003418340C
MHHFAGWWDGFELWVAGLPFLPQFVVVLVGAIPLSFLIAYGLDRGLRAVLHALGRDRVSESDQLGSEPMTPADVLGPSELPEPMLSGAAMGGPGPMREETV